jgi:hypothetical protein
VRKDACRRCGFTGFDESRGRGIAFKDFTGILESLSTGISIELFIKKLYLSKIKTLVADRYGAS